MPKLSLCLLLMCALMAGCSTVTGPEVSKEEIQKATSELQLKALAYRTEQIKRINRIGYRIVHHIPTEDIAVKPRPFLGLFCFDRMDLTERFFNAVPERGVFVAFLLEDTPAARAGIQPGDVVTAINGRKVDNTRNLVSAIDRLRNTDKADVALVRAGKPMTVSLEVERLPVDVRFSVIDEQSVNAAAGARQVFVTYGLINFTKSDDEIAAVLGHELAHLGRGHINRKMGSQFIKTFIAVGLGVAAEVASSGSGDIVMRSVGGLGDVFGAKFSRDLEREADYFGVKYIYLAGYDPQVAATFHERFAVEIPATMTRDYFSTHPSSPERTIRVQKAVEELKTKHGTAPNASE
jgi:membrane-associated protease RseP (regulator of RpoE activity)